MRKENYPELAWLEKFWNKEKNAVEFIDAKIENKSTITSVIASHTPSQCFRNTPKMAF